MQKIFFSSAFLKTLFINFLWQNFSEICRYFLVVMPMMREAFPQIPDIAPMNIPVFMIWSVWGMILLITQTIFTWTYLEHYGNNTKNAVQIGTLVWIAIFGILWLALYNMNLATLPIMGYALALSWVEMLVASLIVAYGMKHFRKTLPKHDRR